MNLSDIKGIGLTGLMELQKGGAVKTHFDPKKDRIECLMENLSKSQRQNNSLKEQLENMRTYNLTILNPAVEPLGKSLVSMIITDYSLALNQGIIDKNLLLVSEKEDIHELLQNLSTLLNQISEFRRIRNLNDIGYQGAVSTMKEALEDVNTLKTHLCEVKHLLANEIKENKKLQEENDALRDELRELREFHQNSIEKFKTVLDLHKALYSEVSLEVKNK